MDFEQTYQKLSGVGIYDLQTPTIGPEAPIPPVEEKKEGFKYGGGNPKEANVEDKNIEVIGSEELFTEEEIKVLKKKKSPGTQKQKQMHAEEKLKNKLIFFGMLILIWIVLNLYLVSFSKFLYKIHDQRITWQRMLLYALIATVILFTILYASDTDFFILL